MSPARSALGPKALASEADRVDAARDVVFDTRSKVSLNRASGQESKFDVVVRADPLFLPRCFVKPLLIMRPACKQYMRKML